MKERVNLYVNIVSKTMVQINGTKARIVLLVDLPEFFSDLGSGSRKKGIKSFCFNFSRKNSKTSKVNQQSALNLS